MNKTSLVFTGDIGFDNYMSGRWDDDGLLSGEVLKFLKDSDHLIVNVEGPVSKAVKKVDKNGVEKLTHTIDPKATVFLDKIGADIWSICNNHIMDAGSDGLKDTLKEASLHGAHTIGAGMDIKEASKPLILNEAGGIGMFCVGYQRACRKADESTPGCFSWSDLDRIKKTIADIKKTCKYCIVVAHAGEEFTALPTCYTRDRYIEYLNMGADAVVSHHPHVPMNYETFEDGKVIFYSLGNFVFDTDYQRSQPYTEDGVLVRLVFDENGFSFAPMGIKLNRETGCIEKSELPAIFTDVDEKQYRLLEPLSCKAFIASTKRQLTYLKPAEFKDATEEKWLENFYEPLRSGRVPGETLDMQIIVPISKKADDNSWKQSTLEGVKNFILSLL